MVKSILKWTDVKFEEALQDSNSTRGFAKSLGVGVIEGVVDAFVIVGALGYVGGIISMIKN